MTDDTGSPIGGALVAVDYNRGGEFSSPPAICAAPIASCWIKTLTDGAGRYSIVFEPGSGSIFNADAAGIIYTVIEGYESNFQVLSRGATEIVQNVRPRRVRTINAGQSTTVAVEADSSLCSDGEDLWLLHSRCEIVTILTGEAGTLTIRARPTETSGIVPVVFFATTGRYATPQVPGPGTASVGVHAGERYRVFVGIPNGTASRVDVATLLR